MIKKEPTKPTGIALEFIRHWLSPAFNPPERVLGHAKRCLIDGIGCGLFGAAQPWTRIMTEEVLSDGSSGPCTMFGSTTQVAAPQAALVNGTAIHGYELDDLLPAALIHPGTVIVPAVLAAAEASNASGKDVLRAIVAGYEATSRLSIALGSDASHRGFHKTAVVGPVSAAIACSVVAGLTAEQATWAVGLACSTSSGIKAFAGGSGGGMVKRMHAGRAAESGVRAARLGARGFTGPAAAIDGPYGLLEVFGASTAKPEALTAKLGEEWAMDGLWFKVYPICGWIQGVVQLIGGMRGSKPISLDAVRKVTVGTSAFAVKNNAIYTPTDEMEAQYSIPYCAAVALEGDANSPAEFESAAYTNPARRDFAQRVELKVDPESDAVYPARFGTRVTLEFANGEVKEAATLDPHGTPADPCTNDELEAKFRRLATQAKARVDQDAIVAAVRDLGALGSVRDLTKLLRV